MKNRPGSYVAMHPPVKLSETLAIYYQVRISRRARHVRLRISAHDGLTVVAPSTFELSRIPAIVETKKKWIAAHLERFAAAGQFGGQATKETLPEVITLPALGENWRVEYCATKSRYVAAMSYGNGRLVVRGAIGDGEEHACRAAMRRWLARRAVDPDRSLAGGDQRTARIALFARGDQGPENKVGELFPSEDDQPELQAPFFISLCCSLYPVARTLPYEAIKSFTQVLGPCHEPGARLS